MIAIYARQSIDKKDSISIESQIEICRREAQSEDVKVYRDKGYSGKNTQRPEFKCMMNDVENGLISKIVVYRLDRISRALIDFAKMMEVFERHHVEFVSSTEKFDTSTPMGKAMLSIIMIFAQLERETIQQRIKDNYYARGKKGMFLGGKTPYGYAKRSARVEGVKTSILEPDEHEQIYLKMIFEEYGKPSASLGSIVKLLNSKGVPAPFGGKWESTKIARILRNPVYVQADADIYVYYKSRGCIISNDLADFVGENGCYLYGKRDRSAAKYTDVTNHVLSLSIHKGMIPSDLFLECQHKLDNNKQIKNSGKGKYTWLTGLTKCGYCGYAMTVTTYKEYKYLTCRGRSAYNACDGFAKTVYLQDIEDHVEKHIISKCKELSQKGPVAIKNDAVLDNAYKVELVGIDEQIDRLVTNLATSNDVVAEYINKKISELDARKKEIIVNHAQAKHSDDKVDIKNILQKSNKWGSLTFEDKKEVAKALIDRINIYDDKIDIVWKY